MTNSAATPVIEYHIETLCGRFYSWSATSPSDLFYDFKMRTGLNIATAMPYTQYEAEQAILEGQEGYNHELQNDSRYNPLLQKGA